MKKSNKIIVASGAIVASAIAIVAGFYCQSVNPVAAQTAELAPIAEVEPIKSEDESTKLFIFTHSDGDAYKVVREGEENTSTEISDERKLALPISMKLSYKLNGQPIAASEIAGKSGKVEIRFDYNNNHYKDMPINGEERRMYAPYAAATSVILDAKKFSNIASENGSIISDGGHIMVTGMALPGMNSNFKTDALNFPDYFTITADVQDFELDNTMTIISNQIFTDIDASELDKLNDIANSADALKDAVKQLNDGADKLENGLTELLVNTQTLAAGVNSLKVGADVLAEGETQLKAGIDQLISGSSQLTAGLEQLSAKGPQLTAGAQGVFNTLLAQTTEQVNSKLKASFPAGVPAPQIPALTIENYGAVLDQLCTKLDALHIPSDEVKGAKASLDQYNQFYLGLQQYAAGVSNAKDGANQLKAGSAQLGQGYAQFSGGFTQIKDGLAELQSKMPSLNDGVGALKGGAEKLSDGLNRLDREGVRKIEQLSSEMKKLNREMHITLDLAKQHRKFANEEKPCSFIYRSDSIRK